MEESAFSVSLLKDPELRHFAVEMLEAELRIQNANAVLAEHRAEEAEVDKKDREARNGSVRHLPVTNVITTETADAWINALEHWGRRDPGGDITIEIRSPGGEIGAGLALYDAIQRLRRAGHHVTTRGSGDVMSMAAVLLQAGDERVLDARAKVLIHEGSRVYRENSRVTAAEEEDMRKYTDMLRDDILEILSERSKMTKAQIVRKWKRKDWFLQPAEALKLGFVDRVE